MTLRIGVLGAAGIVPMALLRPARKVPEVTIAAVAARDGRRAAAFSRKHGIARVHEGYAALLDDAEVDAVYIPLPNSHHAEWAVRAIEAGKHVLVEKPFTSNADEAEQVARAVAKRGDRVMMEAFHWRYHPLAARMRAILDGGELGAVRHVETWMCAPIFPSAGNIRYQMALAGGLTMDVGSYAIHILRTLAGEEPTVTGAEVRVWSGDSQIDRWMRADFAFAGGARTGRMTCAMWSSTLFKIAARVECERGELRVFNPVAPQFYHRLTIRTADGRSRRERVPGDSSYTYQLRAFAAATVAVGGGAGGPNLTGPADSVANMRVIDAVYRAAGLRPRGTPA